MLVRSSLPDLYLQSMLPAIQEVVMAKYAQFPEQFPQFFRVLKSSRSIEQTTEVTGLSEFVQVPENQTTVFDQPYPGYNKTYVHAQYSLGFKVSKVAFDDDQFGVVRKLATELGRSAKETREVIPANVFNQGRNPLYPGPDGQPLFSLAHPLPGGSFTQTNMLAYASDPDVTAIQLALTDMRTTIDARGKKLRIPPRNYVVPPKFAFVAAEILGGQMRSDTADHTINAFRNWQGMPGFDNWKVWDYLTTTDTFILADPEDTELRFYNREPFNTVHDIDFASRSIMTAGWMRFSCGFNGFYGTYCIPGL
jgi:phage major head subunit gpT-like protein